MRKSLLASIVALACALVLVACGGDRGTATPAADEGSRGPKIVCTIFPAYDWVREVLGDNLASADLTLLLDSGIDLHSYQPTATDIMRISDCDLLVYVGGESDAWVADALAEARNPGIVAVSLVDALGSDVEDEEVKEGMQAEHVEKDEDEPETDEHVWLSPRRAQRLVRAISAALAQVDPANAEAYHANAASYVGELARLDEDLRGVVAEGARDTLLFADRFPFRYLIDDLGLDYYAAFVGCSAETEASFETITFLAKKVDELGLDVVLTCEGADHRLAETIVANAASRDIRILEMDSLQSTTAADVEAGATYLTAMRKNLDVLRQALA